MEYKQQCNTENYSEIWLQGNKQSKLQRGSKIQKSEANNGGSKIQKNISSKRKK